jgi:hypothetical protein
MSTVFGPGAGVSQESLEAHRCALGFAQGKLIGVGYRRPGTRSLGPDSDPVSLEAVVFASRDVRRSPRRPPCEHWADMLGSSAPDWSSRSLRQVCFGLVEVSAQTNGGTKLFGADC